MVLIHRICYITRGSTTLRPVAGTTVRSVKLGQELRRLRKAAGVEPDDAARAIERSPSLIGHFERGIRVPAASDLTVLVRDVYGVTDDEVLTTLKTLRSEAAHRSPFSTYGLPDWLEPYVSLESEAVELRCVELHIIPGLLQTEQYMRRLFRLDGRWGPDQVSKYVAARLLRQERLLGSQPLRVSAVVSKAALEMCAHETEEGLAAGQLTLLAERAKQPNINLQILPFEAGMHPVGGPFSLLRFPQGLLDDVAYQEDAWGGRLIEKPPMVAHLAKLFDELRTMSLDRSESRALIAQLVKQHTKQAS